MLLLAWLLYRIGATALVRSLADVGWGFLLVVGLQVVAIVPNAMAWRRMLPPEHRAAAPLPAIAAMLLAGDAINAVTPSAVVGGELVRVSLLRRRVPIATAVGSTALAATAQVFAQLLFVLAGVPVAIALIPDGAFRGALLSLAALAFAALALLIGILRSRGGWTALRRWLDRVGWWRALRRNREASWRALADATLGALRRRPGDFALSVALYGAGWLVGAVEVLLILSLLHVPVGWRQAFAIEALSVAIEGVFFFVPAKMGTQEGGKYLIFHVLRLDPARGIALGFVRRLRELVWAAVGLVLLGIAQRRGAGAHAGPASTTGATLAGEAPLLRRTGSGDEA